MSFRAVTGCAAVCRYYAPLLRCFEYLCSIGRTTVRRPPSVCAAVLCDDSPFISIKPWSLDAGGVECAQVWSAGAFVQMTEWRMFVDEAGVSDNSSKYCRKSDCDRVFIAANFEVGRKNSAMNEANPDNCLLRFEFMEAMVRLSQIKYTLGYSGVSPDQAFKLLIHRHVRPSSSCSHRSFPRDPLGLLYPRSVGWSDGR